MSLESALLQQIKNKNNIKSFQTGFVNTDVLSTGTGEDLSYLDVTISNVDTSKCIILFTGANSNGNMYKSGSTTATECTTRLTSSTNLRISSNSAFSDITGRWTVIEFN